MLGSPVRLAPGIKSGSKPSNFLSILMLPGWVTDVPGAQLLVRAAVQASPNRRFCEGPTAPRRVPARIRPPSVPFLTRRFRTCSFIRPPINLILSRQPTGAQSDAQTGTGPRPPSSKQRAAFQTDTFLDGAFRPSNCPQSVALPAPLSLRKTPRHFPIGLARTIQPEPSVSSGIRIVGDDAISLNRHLRPSSQSVAGLFFHETGSLLPRSLVHRPLEIDRPVATVRRRRRERFVESRQPLLARNATLPTQNARLGNLDRFPLCPVPTHRRARLERPRAWQPDHSRIARHRQKCPSCYKHPHERRRHPPRHSSPYLARTQCLPTMARGPPASQSAIPCRLCTCPCRPMNPIWSSKTTLQKVCAAGSIGASLRFLADLSNSAKGPAGSQGQDLVAVQEELCPRKGRPLSGFAHRAADPEPHGIGGSMSACLPPWRIALLCILLLTLPSAK